MNYKVKTRKVTAPRNVKNSEQLKKRKITENADIDVSPKKKPNKLAKSQKEEDNNLVEDESLSEDGQWQSSVERSALVENLKSIIKACGMSILPVIYKKAKQAIDDKRETIVVKELEGILSREGLSKIPAEKDVLWPITMRSREQMESGPYPVREGELDCSYYIRTGVCRFGPTCRFNHPPNRKLAIATAMMKGEYPERIGQPECEYYLKTGTCKFGGTCIFHHPRDKAGITGRVALNVLGYPLRPGQPSSALSSENQPPSAVNIQNDGASHQGDSGNIASEDGSVPMGYYAFQKDNVFPERPGQSECQFYMKTGDCKFGAVCKFHHPKERLIPVPDCHLSPIGLPLRPGEPVCVFYSRYGICKFGPSCKFDHPMRVFAYNTPASSSTDFAAIHRFLASSPGTVPANFSSDGLMDGSYTNNRRLSLSEARQKPSGDNNADSE
ncbi:zinc finger CCCH domain-containing protein 57-like isoform X4 [Salvia splendens]|uniref:zinc finger CCCH domain-containing protein 57-like isoform X4 n=1 Tax=Salvia splendens TaxID=180675 RepID=UPI001C2769A2|nr:zinc finger CCCH domain-containing protein 57-like isoform X4 [Salvia splendens]